jgi:hypothetical protein
MCIMYMMPGPSSDGEFNTWLQPTIAPTIIQSILLLPAVAAAVLFTTPSGEGKARHLLEDLVIAPWGGACGPEAKARCPGETCCSKWGYCGSTTTHCGLAEGCQVGYGTCTGVTPTPAPTPTPTPVPSPPPPSPNPVPSPPPPSSTPTPSPTPSPTPTPTPSPAPAPPSSGCGCAIGDLICFCRLKVNGDFQNPFDPTCVNWVQCVNSAAYP